MTRLQLSPAASGLLRALRRRCGKNGDRILLIECRSVDWQSLAFVGERHEVELRVVGPASDEIAAHLMSGLDEAELAIGGHVVADISAAAEPVRNSDGTVEIRLEALTLRCD